MKCIPQNRTIPFFDTGIGNMIAKKSLGGRLTPREHTVLQLLFKGCTNQDIGDTLNVTYGTVKNEVSSILQKLGARHRTEAVAFAIRELKRERVELIRKIIQVCAFCPHFKGLGWYSFCNRKESRCRNKKVQNWLKELAALEKILEQEVN